MRAVDDEAWMRCLSNSVYAGKFIFCESVLEAEFSPDRKVSEVPSCCFFAGQLPVSLDVKLCECTSALHACRSRRFNRNSRRTMDTQGIYE